MSIFQKDFERDKKEVIKDCSALNYWNTYARWLEERLLKEDAHNFRAEKEISALRKHNLELGKRLEKQKNTIDELRGEQ